MKSIPMVRFFDEINNLTTTQKNDRLKLAKEIKDYLGVWFDLLLLQKEYGNEDMAFAEEELKNNFFDIIAGRTDDDFIAEYVPLITAAIVESTERNKGDKWYLSDDRATFIAENEALSVFNHEDYRQAVKRGFTRKQWVDMKDDRERATHIEVGSSIIPIKDKFQVGAAMLDHPHDMINGAEHPEELCGCRCYAVYLK